MVKIKLQRTRNWEVIMIYRSISFNTFPLRWHICHGVLGIKRRAHTGTSVNLPQTHGRDENVCQDREGGLNGSERYF